MAIEQADRNMEEFRANPPRGEFIVVGYTKPGEETPSQKVILLGMNGVEPFFEKGRIRVSRGEISYVPDVRPYDAEIGRIRGTGCLLTNISGTFLGRYLGTYGLHHNFVESVNIEEDDPAYKVIISGDIIADLSSSRCELGRVTRREDDGYSRELYMLDDIRPGYGFCILAYEGLDNPPAASQRLPFEVRLEGEGLEEVAQNYSVLAGPQGISVAIFGTVDGRSYDHKIINLDD